MPPQPASTCFFFFNDTATTEIYTLSLHDALPIFVRSARFLKSCRNPSSRLVCATVPPRSSQNLAKPRPDRKSTRLNSSHLVISYAVFCLKKKTAEVPIFVAVNKIDLPAANADRLR